MRSQRSYLILLFITLFQVMVGFGVIIPILPAFARSLGASSLEMGLLVTVWAGAQFLFAPLWGNLSDRIGRRSILIIGLTGYCVAFLGMATAQHLWVLLAARLVGGMLSAATIPVAQAYIADITPDVSARGQRMAWMGSAMNLGFICGPTIGGLLAPFGTQATFFIVAALAALNAVATWLFLPEPPQRAARKTQPAMGRLELFRAALSGPMLVFSLLVLITTFGGSTMFSMLGFFMMDRFEAGPELIGLVFTAEGIFATVVQGVGVGWAMNHLGESRTVRYAFVLGAAGLLLLAWSPTVPVLFVAACLISGALSFLRPTVTAMASKYTTLDQGITMGVQTSFDSLGRATGPLVAGTLYGFAPWMPFVGAGLLYLAASVGASRSEALASPRPVAHDPAPSLGE